MPCEEKGGAEKQFRFLLNAFREKRIRFKVIYDEKSRSRILNFMNLIVNVFFICFMNAPRIAIVYDVYGKYVIPLLKMLGIKVIYSERNNGKHRLAIGKKCIACADVHVTNSKAAITNMREYISSSIEYIPNGVSLPSSFKDEKGTVSKIIIPARIHPSKHQQLIVDVAKMKKDLEFYLYGKIDDNQYYVELMNNIQKSKLKNIHYMGYEADLEKKIQEFDLVLLVAENEGNSNVILEAFANEILCITSALEANKELIRDNIFLFENNVESIIDTLEQVTAINDSERKMILKRNREFVEKNYSIDRMCRKYIELIQ